MRSLWISVLLAALCTEGAAQEWSLSTNAADYADFGTLNAEMGYAVARHWNITAGVRYNPFSFRSDGEPMQNRQRTFSAGVRYWPWHIYSGWWLGGKAQFQEYNRGGIRSPRTREGERVGGGLSAGYAYMLAPWLNLDLGLGLWAGQDRFTVYSCPVCGLTEDRGRAFFVLPNEVLVTLSVIF